MKVKEIDNLINKQLNLLFSGAKYQQIILLRIRDLTKLRNFYMASPTERAELKAKKKIYTSPKDKPPTEIKERNQPKDKKESKPTSKWRVVKFN